jgi:NTE family protein
MLEALYEIGVAPQLIIGTSVGAINGAYVASRPQTPDTARALGEVWRGLKRSDVFPLHLVEGLLGFVGLKSHLVPSRALRRLAQIHFDVPRLEEYPIPLHVIATDVFTGDEVRLSEGDTVEAVLASAAIAGVFPPVKIGGRLLIDGGSSNFAPISHAIELGATTVYVLTSGSACALRRRPRGAVPMALHASSLLVTRRLRTEVEALADAADLIVIPPPCPVAVAPHDFSRSDELIRASLDTSRAFLESRRSGVRSLPFPSHQLRKGA